MRKFTGLALVLAVVAMLGVGCPPVTTVVVNVDPSTAPLTVGDTQAFTASSTNAADVLNWTVEPAGVITLSAATGTNVTATAVAVGTATITVTGSLSAATDTASVTVTAVPVIPPANDAAGLNVTVESVTIPADGKPLIVLTMKNNNGTTIAKSELTRASFLMTRLEENPPAGSSKHLLSYTNKSIASNPAWTVPPDTEMPAKEQVVADAGTIAANLTQRADGKFEYKFKASITDPNDTANFEHLAYIATAAHQLGAQITRKYSIDGLTYVANPIYRFKPAGGTITTADKREISDTATCNGCHGRLEAHGGSRREFQYCIMCHNPQTADPETGNTVDMGPMVHKIHLGSSLPSVQAGGLYEIIGYNGSLANFSEVIFPNPLEATGPLGGKSINCSVCHPQTATGAPNAAYSVANIASCGSCHDRTWFGSVATLPAGYTLHAAPIAATAFPNGVTDAQCAGCHVTLGIEAVHAPLETLTTEHPGIAVGITNVALNAENKLVLTLTIKDGFGQAVVLVPGAGQPNLRVRSRVGYMVGNDYAASSAAATIADFTVNPGLLNATLIDAATGTYEYTFGTALPLDQYTKFGVGLEARKNYTDGTGAVVLEQGTLTNNVVYFTVADNVLTQLTGDAGRVTIVSDALCNKCHYDIRFHGAQRFGVAYCAVCHNPNLAVDGASFNFKEMIHGLHKDIGIIGSRCSACHVDDSFDLPMRGGATALPTVVGVVTTQPITGACLSCHTDAEAVAHAATATLGGVETCTLCHGEASGTPLTVSQVHAMVP